MLEELLTRNINQMNTYEMEEECRELEDVYAEALKDNADFEVLGEIWRRIRALQRQMRPNRE